MNIDTFLIAVISLGGIVFTYWFFLMKPEEKTIEVNTSTIDIFVEGGYSPNRISIPKGKRTTLNFFRKDPSSCLEEVVLPDFKIRKYLPLNQKVKVTLIPQKTGAFDYTCGMNMFHGKIIVT